MAKGAEAAATPSRRSRHAQPGGTRGRSRTSGCSTMSRRALVCGYGVPQHDRDSGSQRLWHFIRFLLDDGWTVDFLAASTVRDDKRYVRNLLSEGVTVHDGTVED